MHSIIPDILSVTHDKNGYLSPPTPPPGLMKKGREGRQDWVSVTF